VKILVISNLYPPDVLGGYEILCAQVVSQLRERGHTVRVLTTGGHGPDVDVDRRLRLYVPFGQPAGLMRARRFTTSRHNHRVTAAVIREWQPERIFIWSQLRLTLGAARAAEQSGIPVSYTLNDEHIAGYLGAGWRPSPGGVARWAIDRTILRHLTCSGVTMRHVTCISDALKGNLVRAGLPLSHARVIHQGIPVGRFPVRLARPPLGGPLRILYAGQLHAYKGVHTVIEAAARVGRRLGGNSVTVTIAGDGGTDYRQRLETLARESGIEVRFAGRVAHTDLPAVYRAHDVFVFPSIWQEPFGLTHLEAMASGTPVISTIEGGPAEFLCDNDNALVFRAGEADHLAWQITRLVATPGLGEHLAARARAMVEQRFTLERYVADLEAFLMAAA
jgi:glycogen(starch) synthase